MHRGADLDNRPAHVLAEARLVAELAGEGGGGNKDDGLAEDGDLKDFTVCFGEALEGEPGVGRVNLFRKLSLLAGLTSLKKVIER